MPFLAKLEKLPRRLARLKAVLSAAIGPARGPHFYLESPRASKRKPVATPSPVVVRGWVSPPSARVLRDLEVLIDGELVARTTPRLIQRRDDRRFFAWTGVNRSGFCTEVILDRWMNRAAEMTLRVDYGDGPHVLARLPLNIEGRVGEARTRRERSFSLGDLLACPLCAGSQLHWDSDRVQCRECGESFENRRGTPIFARSDNPVISRLLESNHTHPYSNESRELIGHYSNGVLLDYGAGHPRSDCLYPNVVLHEAVHFNHIDVVSLTPRLPYRDNCFDAVISQAVFEHVPRPWEAAAELHRVLKPGGQIHIDTAFMQPYHSDPFHFFNMTLPGIREIFRPFREVRSGVKQYQLPSFGLRMQLSVMLEHMNRGEWRDRMADLREALDHDSSSFDASLDPEGQNRLAAGFYFHGVK
jgi:SAM-dependent methyltransferase